MARYLKTKRDTELFVAGSLDRLLPEDSVARAIWAGLEPLDFGLYDALYTNDAVGRSALNPRGLSAVWILAILRGGPRRFVWRRCAVGTSSFGVCGTGR